MSVRCSEWEFRIRSPRPIGVSSGTPDHNVLIMQTKRRVRLVDRHVEPSVVVDVELRPSLAHDAVHRLEKGVDLVQLLVPGLPRG